jgi:hypothetical protein
MPIGNQKDGSNDCKVDDLAGHRVHWIIGVHAVLHRVFFH